MWEEVASVVPDVTVLRRLLFAAVQIPKSSPKYAEIVREFAFGAYEQKPSPEKIRVLLENLEFLSGKAFDTDKQLLADLVMQKGCQGHPLGVVLVPTNSICKACGGRLVLRADRPSYLTLYTDDMGTVPGTIFRKYCSNSHKGCAFTQHYGYHSFNHDDASSTVADSNWAELPYFVSTSKTGFAMAFLERFDAELLLGQISYKQKSDIYNYYHKYERIQKKLSHSQNKSQQVPIDASPDSEGDEDSESSMDTSTHTSICARACLDRRRLEEAHMKYAVLSMYQRYTTHFSKWSIAPSIKQTLEDVTPTFYRAFSAYYTSHQCSYPGCTTVLVLDGNMKNRRNVCAATEAGFIEYPSLPGTIKTGCQLSPLQTSNYCFHHAPRVSKLVDCDPEVEDTASSSATSQRREAVVKFIVGKKLTRSTTYYQVAWLGPNEKVTWEPASSIPPALVEEFEAGLSSTQESLSTEPMYGVITHTLVTSTAEPQQALVPPVKRSKFTTSWEEGAFKDDQLDSEKLMCNTEKDKGVRLHHRTAGVLAGMWPCGIVVLLAELFTAESKSQVYAALHELLSNHSHISSSLQFICYDDGCYLRKYSTNPSRKQLTHHSLKLATTEIVIDKMHMAGHTDMWCHQHCDPRSFTELENVDTEVCEQHFSWLSKYARMTRRMNRNTFVFFMLTIIDMHNRREEQKLHRGGFM